MTREEIIKAIEQLPMEDRLALRDEISNGMDDSVSDSTPRNKSIVEHFSKLAQEEADTARQRAGDNGRSSLSQTLYGILQFEAGPPTDEEVKEIIADYLFKKYH